MKALRIVLIVVGLLTLIFSVVSLLVPWERIVSFCHRFSVTLPAETEANATMYMVRLGAVTFAWAGFLFLVAAANVIKYLVLVRSLALALICIGLTCILVGARNNLPSTAFLIDGLFCLISGGLIWTLSSPLGSQAKQAAPPVEPDV